jgi:hypothetical protein
MSPARRTRQRDRILELLRSRSPEWIPAFEVAALALQYNSRLLELRRAGHHIESRPGELVDGRRHTWFRLVQPAAAPTNSPRAAAPAAVEPSPKPFGAALFPDLPPANDPAEPCSRDQLRRQLRQERTH